MQLTSEERFLRACQRQPVDATPVWFMRQAGRALPAYRQMRKRYDFFTLCQTPEAAAEVSLLPVRLLGVDAAVIFADIMLPLAGMAVKFDLVEGVGPVVQDPIASRSDVDALRMPEPEEGTPYVLETIRLVRKELTGKQAVIGFAGAPFTLACYLIEGKPSREFVKTKALMRCEPATWHALLAKLTEMTVRYLCAQVTAGAQAVQLFDSWAGLLSPRDYAAYVQPYVQYIMSRIQPTGVPVILFGTGTATLLPLLAAAGPSVISVDWRIPLDEAWEDIGWDKAIQGNLDPTVLLAPWPVVEAEARDVLKRATRRPGHIFNLGHGVLPETPPDHLRRLVELVHAESANVT
jgi:uroporphyrinogen decarboxylase